MRSVKFLSSLIVVTLLVSGMIFGVKPAPAHAQGGGTYVVTYGDSLFSIAAKLNVSVSELATINGLYDVNVVYVGQVLKVPPSLGGSTTGGTTGQPVVVSPAPVVIQPVPAQPAAPQQPAYPNGTTVTTTTKYTTYVVRAGDNLSAIAAKFGTTVQALMSANGLNNPNLVYAGMVLNIVRVTTVVNPPLRPSGIINNGKYRVYVIQPGDNLFGIAAKFKRDVYAIAKLNNLLNLNAIYSGLSLLIP